MLEGSGGGWLVQSGVTNFPLTYAYAEHVWPLELYLTMRSERNIRKSSSGIKQNPSPFRLIPT